MDVLSWRFEQIGEAGLDAVVCFLPHHVLMLSGYRPRLGSGVALATAHGEIRLAVPSDEVELARAAGAQAPIGYGARPCNARFHSNRRCRERCGRLRRSSGPKRGLGIVSGLKMRRR